VPTNFHEKAHFVKPTWRLPWPSATAPSALSAMLPSALSLSQSLGGSVHRMRSVFSDYLRRCNLRNGLSCLRVDQVRIAQSPYVRSEARSGTGRASRLRTAVSGSPPPPLLLLLLLQLRCSACSKLPGLWSGGCCAVARRPQHLAINCVVAQRASSLRPPPLVSWRSWLPERLSSLHGV
jgi:hypothetical protein